jgi:hypothetical protein
MQLYSCSRVAVLCSTEFTSTNALVFILLFLSSCVFTFVCCELVDCLYRRSGSTRLHCGISISDEHGTEKRQNSSRYIKQRDDATYYIFAQLPLCMMKRAYYVLFWIDRLGEDGTPYKRRTEENNNLHRQSMSTLLALEVSHAFSQSYLLAARKHGQ